MFWISDIVTYHCLSTQTEANEWPKSKALNTTCEQGCRATRTLSFTAGGNTKWHRHFGRQLGSFLLNQTYSHYMNQQMLLLRIYPNTKLMSTQKPAHRCLQQLYLLLPKLGIHQDVLHTGQQWWHRHRQQMYGHGVGGGGEGGMHAESDMEMYIQFSSVTQSCLTLCDPMDCSAPGLPVHHNSRSLLKLMSI